MVVRDLPLVQYLFAALAVLTGLAFAGLDLKGTGTHSAIAVGLGALLAWLSPVTTSTFNHRSGTYEVRRSGLFYGSLAGGDLADISDVSVEEATTETTYRVVLVLYSGAQVPLSTWWTSTRRGSNRVAKRLAAFLRDEDAPRSRNRRQRQRRAI